MSKVAVVTGSNKGIGLGIVRALCKKYDGTVYLTSRDAGRGEQAVETLKKEGLNPALHLLDIGDKASVETLRDYMKEKYGGIDILVNNAAIAFKQAATESFGVQATVTLKTNYWDTKEACEILFPILKPGARVVNVSSSAGFLGHLDKADNQEKAAILKKKLASDDLQVSELDALMKEFEETANAGTHGAHGWHSSTYSASKIGLSALSRIQQRELAKDESRPDIVLSHVHPGYVDTDMTSHKGPLTIDRGAESSVYAALLPANTSIRGAYIWHDSQIVDWVNGPTPPMT
jgi:carbonyl reductase 1